MTDYHIVDLENTAGVSGSIKLDKGQYDEADHEDLTMTLIRVIDAWIKRRDFIHRNIQFYKKLC